MQKEMLQSRIILQYQEIPEHLFRHQSTACSNSPTQKKLHPEKNVLLYQLRPHACKITNSCAVMELQMASMNAHWSYFTIHYIKKKNNK